VSKKLYYLKTKHISLPKNAVSTNVTDTKNTPKIPKFRQQTFLAVCTRSMSWCLRNWRKYVQKKWIRL